MCGRYWIDESSEMKGIVDKMQQSSLLRRCKNASNIRVSGEVCPSEIVPVIAPDKNGIQAVFPMKWGFSGKSFLINARTETAFTKQTFRNAWLRHRCIIPSAGYFEWEHCVGNSGKTTTGDKYYIHAKDAGITWLCGLYRIEDGFPVFVILTREPGDEIRFIHNRMPLILPDHLALEWIHPNANPKELSGKAVTDVLFEKADDI